MGILSKVFSSGAGNVIKEVLSGVDEIFTSKEERIKLESELTQKLAELDLKREELAEKEVEAHLADIKSARDSNVAIQNSDKASWLSKNVAYILDVFVGLIWGGLTLYLSGRALRLLDSSPDLTAVLSIYSTVTAVFMISMNFHRGTSRSSETKQATIEKMMSK